MPFFYIFLFLSTKTLKFRYMNISKTLHLNAYIVVELSCQDVMFYAFFAKTQKTLFFFFRWNEILYKNILYEEKTQFLQKKKLYCLYFYVEMHKFLFVWWCITYFFMKNITYVEKCICRENFIMIIVYVLLDDADINKYMAKCKMFSCLLRTRK